MKKLFVVFMVLFAFGVSSAFGEIVVYDDNDDFMGYLISLEDYSEIIIYVPSLGRFIKFKYEEGAAAPGPGIIEDFSGFVYYTQSSGCTGQPYMAAHDAHIDQMRYFIKRHCSKSYAFSDPSGVSTSFNYHSYIDHSCTCFGYNNTTIYGYPLVEVTLPFDYPIALPLGLEYESGAKSVVIPLFKSGP